MTDLEKYKNVFNETNITYICTELYPINKERVVEISVNEKSLDNRVYGAGLNLLFNKETGKLIKISPWGE